ncbi:MAG TPA: hypothetical protein VFR67_25325 [Pilimelia sp.]|nr:hypothetical protein [Pilimelia sp.]
MNGTLAAVVIVASLVLAVWSLLTAVLNRPTGATHLVAAVLIEAGVLVLATVALVTMASGDPPAEAATFVGYLITTVCLLPTGVVLARMEPTRWGSAIMCGAALILPVLVVRLQQVWEAHG